MYYLTGVFVKYFLIPCLSDRIAQEIMMTPKLKKPPKKITITVYVRPYKNDAERREKLRLFAESLRMTKGGENLL